MPLVVAVIALEAVSVAVIVWVPVVRRITLKMCFPAFDAVNVKLAGKRARPSVLVK